MFDVVDEVLCGDFVLFVFEGWVVGEVDVWGDFDGEGFEVGVDFGIVCGD